MNALPPIRHVPVGLLPSVRPLPPSVAPPPTVPPPAAAAPAFLTETLSRANSSADALHELTAEIQAGREPHPRLVGLLAGSVGILIQIRDVIDRCLGSLDRAGFAPNPRITVYRDDDVSRDVDELTLGVCGSEPPLVLLGPGGDFQTEMRRCESCGELFSVATTERRLVCHECQES